MSNVGTDYNVRFVCVLVLLMLSPVFLFMLSQLILLFVELFSCFTIISTPNDSSEESQSNITFEDIKLATLKKAANGDKAARDWAMKYVFDVQPNDKSVDAQKYNTDQAIIDDAIEAMVAVKVKRKDAVQKIKSLVAKKDYKNVSDLFVDAISFN